MKPFISSTNSITTSFHHPFALYLSQLQYSPRGVLRTMFIILCSISFSLFLPAQQQWTEPVNISNLSEYLNKDADMVVDNKNVIHVVWNLRMELFHEKIMYSSSADDGETWSEPLDLLQNAELWMSQPHIACNSKNNLYVTYDYATGTPDKMVYMKVYDGYKWSEPILVSEGMPGSDYNKVLVDNEDKVFVFWASQGVNVKYRIYQNNSFGEIMEPYFNALPDAYYVYYSAIDKNNKIHWVGYTTEGMPSGTFGHAYFLFDPINNEWHTPQNISVVKAQIGNGIDLLQNQNTAVVTREDTTTWPNPYNDITFLLENDSVNWLQPETIVNIEGDQKNQRIKVDKNNDIHIIEMDEITPGQYGMVHYQKRDSMIWNNLININSTPFKLLLHKNKLYLSHGIQDNDTTWNSDIFFTKYEIITNIKQEYKCLHSVKVYPNPSNDNVFIEFENNKQQHINLSIYDMTGKHITTLINKTKPQGVYRPIWRGMDKHRKEVSPGLYFVRLQFGLHNGSSMANTITQLVEIIK